MIKNDQKDYDHLLGELDELDKAIIRLKVAKGGLSKREIALEVGCSESTVKNRMAKHKVKFAIDEMQKDALTILLEAQKEAARIIFSIAKDRSANNRDRISACNVILKGVLTENVNLNGTIHHEHHLEESEIKRIEQELNIIGNSKNTQDRLLS